MVRRLSILLILALVIGACLSDGGSTTTTVGATTTTAGKTPTTGPTSSVTTTTESTTATTQPDLSGLEGVPIEMRAQLEELIIVAQELRGLHFLSPPNITVVSETELEARVRASIEEQAEDFPADEALYKLLGLLDAEANLENLLADLYGEQVAGLYDGDTGEILVRSREGGLSILQQGTMVHELVHAITDQHFGFDDTFEAMVDEERLDEATALQALVEGDAQFTEVLWVQTLSRSDVGRFLGELLEVDQSSFEASPPFIQDAILFPYDTGMTFVQALYGVDGWETVNQAYTTLPGLPGSTEQIITPGDYQRDLPQVVEIPTIELDGYILERTSVWGEEGFRIMLDQVLGGSISARAADGWGGDSYHQWFDGENAAFLLIYEGDTARDVEELREALLDFALTSVPEEDFVWVDEEGGLLYFIAADETEVGELIRSAVGLS